MRKISILAFTVILFGCNNEKEKIINAFNNFNKANIELDGEKIFELSDSESHNYYSNLLTKILRLDSIGISKLNLTDKMNLLSARAIIADSELKKISPKNLMIKMYTEVSSMDSVKIDSFKKLGVTNVRIESEKANGDFTIDGEALSPRVNLKFSKENGKWKFNIVSMANFTEKQLNTVCEYHGFSHLDYLEWMFSASNIGSKKIKELEDIWNPIIK
ncbi:hypothetical protein [Aquimarina sp. LLG6339-5]|uniref:hypothetical protein n=1 Tax=Aquimarina sp. LLG6339-5 TaxID=3160830 RepID=UPI003869B9D1